MASSSPSATGRLKLAYLSTHPVQYQAPLLRRIAQEPDIDLVAFFGSDFSLREYHDEGFGVSFKWDIPLLDGYKSEFLPEFGRATGTSVASPLNHGIYSRLAGRTGTHADGRPFDALWTHGYATVNSLHAMLAAKALGIPVLLRSDSWLLDRPRSGLKLAAKNAFFAALKPLVSAVLGIGTFNEDYWHHHLGADFPIYRFPYAVDNAWFQQACTRASLTRHELQAELGFDPSRPVILFASKLQTRKRCIDLIEAYARLSPGNGAEPHPCLLIVGDGEERPALEARARELGWPGIRFLGFRNQSELPRYFDLASVFVLPARHEPWGLIVNEVMNASCASIVSTDVGAYPDLVHDGITGFTFPAGDVGALTDALRRVFATPETAAFMGRNALELIKRWSFEEDIQGLRRALAGITGKITA